MRPFLLLPLLALGCSSYGPSTVAKDRFDYSSAVGESWKQQMLLNIVKLRYMDPPIFVEVGQIVGGYTLEGTVGAAGTLNAGSLPDLLTMSGGVRFSDRPTITYTPLTGNAFVKGLMTPLTPDALFFLIQSGWAADTLIVGNVMGINGLRNRTYLGRELREADDDFLRFVRLFRELQLGGALGMRVRQKDKDTNTLLFFHAEGASADVVAKIEEVRKLLKLKADEKEYRLVYGAVAQTDVEIAVQTRSILQSIGELSARVEVPAADVAEGRAAPGLTDATASEGEKVPLIRVRSSSGRPSDAAVAVPYRGRWFYVDDRDFLSKRMMALLMILFSIADTGEKGPMPLLTISTE